MAWSVFLDSMNRGNSTGVSIRDWEWEWTLHLDFWSLKKGKTSTVARGATLKNSRLLEMERVRDSGCKWGFDRRVTVKEGVLVIISGGRRGAIVCLKVSTWRFFGFEPVLEDLRAFFLGWFKDLNEFFRDSKEVSGLDCSDMLMNEGLAWNTPG